MAGSPCSRLWAQLLPCCWITHLWLGISVHPVNVAYSAQMQGFVLCFVLVKSTGLGFQISLLPWKDSRRVGYGSDVQEPLSWRWDLEGIDQPVPSPSLCLCLSFLARSLLVTFSWCLEAAQGKSQSSGCSCWKTCVILGLPKITFAP